jgi:hypothetical protein
MFEFISTSEHIGEMLKKNFSLNKIPRITTKYCLNFITSEQIGGKLKFSKFEKNQL